MLNNEIKSGIKTLPSNLYAQEKPSPLHTFIEDSGLCTIYCPECFAEQPAGKLKKGSKIPLEHEERCKNVGA